MESADLITSLLEPLTTFPLFPKLPLDLRLHIYRIATPYERVVHLDAIFDNTDSDEEEEDEEEELEEWQQPSDENSRHIQALDQVLQEYLTDNKERGMLYFSNRGQSQLERFGFTSSHPRPELLSDAQLKIDTLRSFLKQRPVTMWSPNPIPALLHVCRESRDYLQRLGYALAFPTYTSPAATWFNFNDDVLFLESISMNHMVELNELLDSGILDGGHWHVGQCGESLKRIKKLAVSVSQAYVYRKEVPFSIHEIVQQCGNLQELCLVNNAWQKWYGSNDVRWAWHKDRDTTVRRYMKSSPDEWPIRVELAVEEMYGHRLPLRHWDFEGEVFPEGSLSNEEAENIEKRIRSHDPALHPTVDEKFRRERWTTPRVTFAVVIAQAAVEHFLKKRHRFVCQNENADWSMEPYVRYIDRHFGEIGQVEQRAFFSSVEENARVPRKFPEGQMEITKYIYGPSDLPWPLGLHTNGSSDDDSGGYW